MSTDPESRPGPGGGEGPLSPQQIDALATAMQRSRKALGGARAAALTGYTLVAFGVLSLLMSLGSPTGLVASLAVLAVAWNEREGRKMLLGRDPKGARRLAWNQLWLLAVILLYCLKGMYSAWFHPLPSVAEMETLLGLGEGFFAEAAVGFYTLVLVVGAAFQFGMYRYHAARGGLLEEYLAETPAWVVEVERAVGGR